MKVEEGGMKCLSAVVGLVKGLEKALDACDNLAVSSTLARASLRGRCGLSSSTLGVTVPVVAVHFATAADGGSGPASGARWARAQDNVGATVGLDLGLVNIVRLEGL